MKNTDLHTHSYYSDGVDSPTELVKLAKERGISNLALTDHNSVKGVEEAIRVGKEIGVNVIPAVEITCNEGREVLGYFVDVHNEKLLTTLTKAGQKQEKRVKKICKLLVAIGYDITFEEIYEKFPQARGNFNPFYPLLMFKTKGYGTINNGRAIYKKIKMPPKKAINVVSAIKLVRKAGGVAVLAHPWIKSLEDNLSLVPKYVKKGLKGIELDNGDTNCPERGEVAAKKIKEIASKFNLIITKGSDYHGEEIIKEMWGDHSLGKIGCDESVVEELRKLSKNK